jgi:diguanylate cyclase
MYIESSPIATPIAQAALASMALHEIAPTPQNFAIWYEYHGVQSPDLKRAIDILVSNHRPFDEGVLQDLYERFFSSVREQRALHNTSHRVQQTLVEVIRLVETARSDAAHYGDTLHDVSMQVAENVRPLAVLVERLIHEADQMVGRSRSLGLRLKQSGQKIETLERALEDVRREAATDALTGVTNRRGFDMTLRDEAGAAMNSGDDLTLLLTDIDHFKRFNDSWGHQTGDEVLRLVAGTLRQNIRGRDCVARYGGEEFAVILPATALESAIIVGDKLRRAVEQRDFALRDAAGVAPRITVSIGAACYEPGEPLADWVHRADGALYRAKEEGRNRVIAG